MNQIKIAAFISSQRHKIGLTQAQLAERLSISNRAVSKWETGKSLPDVSIMPDLCDILGITLTELLRGELIEINKQQKFAESSILEILMTQKSLMRKKYWSDMLCGAGVGILCSALYAPDSPKKATISIVGLLMICIGWNLENRIERSRFILNG